MWHDFVMPTPETWLLSAVADATRHGGDDVRPVLEALAKAVTALREAGWNADAAHDDEPRSEPTASSKASRG